eukprot:948301-Amphidinium_carterae.1
MLPFRGSTRTTSCCDAIEFNRDQQCTPGLGDARRNKTRESGSKSLWPLLTALSGQRPLTLEPHKPYYQGISSTPGVFSLRAHLVRRK